jgi:hypothetical protein
MSQAAVPVQLFGMPADGNKVRWTAYDVHWVTNGKISEEWAGGDHDPDRCLQPSVGCLTSPHQRPTSFGPGAVRPSTHCTGGLRPNPAAGAPSRTQANPA